jgi:outer membrane protein TolC
MRSTSGSSRDGGGEIRWVAALLGLCLLASVAGPGPVAAAGQTMAADETTSPIDSTSTAPSPEGDLNRYFVEAARANPGLRASYEAWMAASEKIAAVKGWPDPMVSYTIYLQEVETALGPQKYALAFSQRFPWMGKLSLKGTAQEQAALAAAERFRRARLDLMTQVAKAYYDLAYLERSIAITHENLEILRYHEAVARARYRTDTARYSDLIKVQVELASLDDRLRTLEDRRAPVTAKLNRAIGRPAEAPLEWKVGLASQKLPVDDEAAIRKQVLGENPSLLAMRHDVQRHETLARLAHRNRFPDFTVGVKTIATDPSSLTNFPDEGRDPWMLTVGMTLPLWQGKYSAAKRSEEASVLSAQSKLEQATHDLDSEVEDALFGLRDAKRKVDLFAKGLVPKALQSLESTSTAYQAGTTSFLDFLDAQRTLLVFELDLAQARADLGRHRIEITSLMGSLPDGIPDLPAEEGAE